MAENSNLRTRLTAKLYCTHIQSQTKPNHMSKAPLVSIPSNAYHQASTLAMCQHCAMLSATNLGTQPHIKHYHVVCHPPRHTTACQGPKHAHHNHAWPNPGLGAEKPPKISHAMFMCTLINKYRYTYFIIIKFLKEEFLEKSNKATRNLCFRHQPKLKGLYNYIGITRR